MRETTEHLTLVPTTVRVTFQPTGMTFDVPFGATLFEVAAQAGVEVDTVCGGNGSCGKCKVRVEGDPPPAKSIDYYHLMGPEVQAGFRISCQLQANQDMVVHVPPVGDRTKVRILHEGVQREVPLDPNVHKIHIPYVPPRQRGGVADWDTVKAGLPRAFHNVRVPLHWLRQLPELIRRDDGMTIVVAGRDVIRLEAGDTLVVVGTPEGLEQAVAALRG